MSSPHADSHASQVHMLKIENAALIDGLRKMNAHVTRLEADRHRVLESQPISGSGEFAKLQLAFLSSSSIDLQAR
jgi:hypothetical protein